jgi:hypothetical protein
LCLHQSKRPSAGDTSATQAAALRKASKNILFTVANSNAMNAEILGYRRPVWVVALIWGNAGLLAAFLGWGAFAVYRSRKKIKASKT